MSLQLPDALALVVGELAGAAGVDLLAKEAAHLLAHPVVDVPDVDCENGRNRGKGGLGMRRVRG